MTEETTQNLDERMRKAVLKSLAADDSSSFGGVRVGVLNGIVHLGGVAPTLEIRLKAVELAERVPNVRGIVNRIDAPGAPPPARTVNINLGEENDKIL